MDALPSHGGLVRRIGGSTGWPGRRLPDCERVHPLERKIKAARKVGEVRLRGLGEGVSGLLWS